MKYKKILYSMVAGIGLLIASCAPTHEDAEQVDHIPNMYPKYANVTIPVNIAPLNFLLREKQITNVEVVATIEGEPATESNTLQVAARGRSIQFGMSEWKDFLQKASGKKIKVQVYSQAGKDGWTAYKPFRWEVVGDSIDPYLTYRLIEPDYEVWNRLQIKQRCVENYDEKILADHNLQENRCMNCHAFGNQDPNIIMDP